MTQKFKPYYWDPILLILQIFFLQCLFYICLGFILFLLFAMISDHSSVHQIFQYENLNFRDYKGKLVSCSYILNSVIVALAIWHIVCRTKLCLDFSATILFIHLIISCLICKKFPTTFAWWLINVTSLTLSTITSEYLCMKTEMRQIPMEYGTLADI